MINTNGVLNTPPGRKKPVHMRARALLLIAAALAAAGCADADLTQCGAALLEILEGESGLKNRCRAPLGCLRLRPLRAYAVPAL